MRCFYHPDQEIVATCNVCGKGLCYQCAQLSTPPVCADCLSAAEKEAKIDIEKAQKSINTAIGIGIVFFGPIALAVILMPFAALGAADSVGSAISGFFGGIIGAAVTAALTAALICLMPVIGYGIKWAWKTTWWLIIFPPLFIVVSIIGGIAHGLKEYIETLKLIKREGNPKGLLKLLCKVVK